MSRIRRVRLVGSGQAPKVMPKRRSAVVDFAAMDKALAEPEKPYYYDHGDLNDAYLRGLAHARVRMDILTGRISIDDPDPA